jgi:hypothetical protein
VHAGIFDGPFLCRPDDADILSMEQFAGRRPEFCPAFWSILLFHSDIDAACVEGVEALGHISKV